MRSTLMTLVALASLALGVAGAQDGGNPPAAPPASGGSATGTTSASSGNAGAKWKKSHPRRAQVNGRLNRGVKNGAMTKGQAAADRREERAMAAKDGGHISKKDQRMLNRRIHRQKARDRKAKQANDAGQSAPAAPATPAGR